MLYVEPRALTEVTHLMHEIISISHNTHTMICQCHSPEVEEAEEVEEEETMEVTEEETEEEAPPFNQDKPLKSHNQQDHNSWINSSATRHCLSQETGQKQKTF